MKLIERTNYLERLCCLRGTPDIKIITGIRRSGKSKLMISFMNKVKENDENSNVIYVDFHDMKFDGMKNYKELYDYVEAKYDATKSNYLFIDEVQLCEQFEVAVNAFHNSEKYDIYVTGSNAFLLSADLATLFTGRYVEIHVYPFSYNEYCKYFSDVGDATHLFKEYAIKGGLAGSYVYKTEMDRISYLKSVYNTIINRDLVEKYKLTESVVMDKLCEFMMDNVSNLTSPSKITNTLNSNKLTTNHVTIGKYIKYLTNAFIFYPVKRYDIKGKKYLETAEKYYLSDVGFRYALLGSRNMDYGRLYENIVCIELMRRGYEVYVGKLNEQEIDFVAQKNGEKIYIQVSDNISNEETFKREYSPLLKIKDAYPKLIIANTNHDDYSYEGIHVCDIINWLKG